MQRFSRAMKYGSFALILAGFVGSCAMANANDKKNEESHPAAKPAAAAPHPSAPAAKSSAPAPRPAPSAPVPVSRPSTPLVAPASKPAQPAANSGATLGGRSTNVPANPTASGTHTVTPPPVNSKPTSGSGNAGRPPVSTTPSNGTGNGGRNPANTAPASGTGQNNSGRNPVNSASPMGQNNGVRNQAGPNNAPHNPAIATPPSRGSRENIARNGSAVRVRPNGRVSDVHDVRRGMDVHQGMNGGRSIIVDRPDHSRTFFALGRPGYVARPYSFHGHDFDRRTYVYHGHTYDHFYRGYRFHGLGLHVYAPSFYFGHAYYGWAFNPWASPIRYRWGWMGNPWNRYYGYYFSPYPVYPSAAFWLTDYLISTNLQAAYAAHQEAGEMNGDPSMAAGVAPMTPDVKQEIADEVRNQLTLESQEAQQNAQQQVADPGASGIASVMTDVANGHPRVFVVGGSLDVVDSSGNECALSDGDALQLQSAPPANATAADLVVLASKGGQECVKSDLVSVPLDSLQEMQNHLREVIDQGLQELQTNQGKGGLPQAPASPQMAPAVYTSVAPPPDPNAANEIQQQVQQADQAVNDVTSEAGAPAVAPTISAGQSIADVESILGQPTNKALLGRKVIYNYKGMKVTFIDGRVSNVE